MVSNDTITSAEEAQRLLDGTAHRPHGFACAPESCGLCIERDKATRRLAAAAPSLARGVIALERAHGDLLAVIHRDGGHHVDRVGWKQAAKDAERVVIALRERVRELEASK